MPGVDSDGWLNLSRNVLLNGNLLQMIDDTTLPKIEPLSVEQPFHLPAWSYGFFVIKNAKMAICLWTPPWTPNAAATGSGLMNKHTRYCAQDVRYSRNPHKEPTCLGDSLLKALTVCLYNPYITDRGSVSLIQACKNYIFITVASSPIIYFIY